MQTEYSEEKKLVELLVAGDETAFGKLYYSYSPRLTGFLFKLVKSEACSKELLQEIFIKVWNARESIDPAQSFRSYLFKVSENCVYDFFRKTANDQKLAAAFLRRTKNEYSHVEESLRMKENEQLLQDAINSLPPKRRQIFQMIRIEERSYDEVSLLLNISTSTISDHIVKANKYIRAKLKLWQITILIFIHSCF